MQDESWQVSCTDRSRISTPRHRMLRSVASDLDHIANRSLSISSQFLQLFLGPEINYCKIFYSGPFRGIGSEISRSSTVYTATPAAPARAQYHEGDISLYHILIYGTVYRYMVPCIYTTVTHLHPQHPLDVACQPAGHGVGLAAHQQAHAYSAAAATAATSTTATVATATCDRTTTCTAT